MSNVSPHELRRGRRIGIRAAAVVGLLLFGLFFGVVAAEVVGIIQPGTEGSPSDPPPSETARFGAAHPGELVHGVGALALLALGVVGLVGLIASPESRGFAYQLLGVTVAVAVSLPFAGNPDNVGGQAGPIDPLLLLLILPSVVAALIAIPWRGLTARLARPELLLLAALAAVPVFSYGIDQALLQRGSFPPTADPHHNAHWWVMGIVAFAVALVTAASSLPGRRWVWGPTLAGLASLGVGTASIVAPAAASSVATGWAVAAIVWGGATLWFSWSATSTAGRPSRRR